MFFIILFLLVSVGIVFLIIWNILGAPNNSKLIDIGAIFFLLGGLLFIFLCLIIYNKYYYYSYGFKTEYEIIIEQEKLIREKKEAILTQSENYNKTLNSKDLISLKDKEYLKEMLQEIKEVENKIFNMKESFIKKIKTHNADCSFGLFGLFIVDEKSFLFTKEIKNE